jgi:hypothetical protein
MHYCAGKTCCSITLVALGDPVVWYSTVYTSVFARKQQRCVDAPLVWQPSGLLAFCSLQWRMCSALVLCHRRCPSMVCIECGMCDA